MTAAGESETKRCPNCGPKPVELFSWRNRAAGRRATYCKDCQANYLRSHYARRPDYYKQHARESNARKHAENLERLFRYLVEHPCVDCGEIDIVTLDFDHRDPDAKLFHVTNMVARQPWHRIETEIAKCDVRCANCHRRRTARQFGHARLEWWQAYARSRPSEARTSSA